MKKPKKLLISDVLHYAADHCLAFKQSSKWKQKFSCCAVMDAYDIHKLSGDIDLNLKDVLKGLQNMGCDTYSNTLFRKYGDPLYYEETKESVQGMRYMWLKWAALMAEEQGV